MIDWVSPHSEEFIEEHLKELNEQGWRDVSGFQPLSEEFMEEYADKLDWSVLFQYQKLSESFIEKHMNRITDGNDWYNIFKYQKLSEAFIKRCLDKGVEEAAFARKYQILSEQFLENYINKPDRTWWESEDYQKVSSGFRKKHEMNPLPWSWLYKSATFNKKAVQETELYECHKDYFIAYKAIRKDRYSCFNFQYKYEKGGVYETHADYTDAEDSFGFGAGTKDFCEDYGGFAHCDHNILVRVKIYYKDVARVVHNGDKIRACKIEVLD